MSSQKIADTLYDTLLTADEAMLRELATELMSYRAKYHRSWNGAMKHPFLSKLLTVLDEVTETVMTNCDCDGCTDGDTHAA